jgi:hypothetical protein
VHPQQAEVAQLAEHLAREMGAFVPLGDVGQYAITHPVPNGVADKAFLRGQEGVEAEEVRCGKGGVRHARTVHGAACSGTSYA